MDHSTRAAIARTETKALEECDGAESFCDILTGWLDANKHWVRNEYVADLMAGIRDEISDTRAIVQRARERAGEDAIDTVRDARCDNAA